MLRDDAVRTLLGSPRSRHAVGGVALDPRCALPHRTRVFSIFFFVIQRGTCASATERTNGTRDRGHTASSVGTLGRNFFAAALAHKHAEKKFFRAPDIFSGFRFHTTILRVSRVCADAFRNEANPRSDAAAPKRGVAGSPDLRPAWIRNSPAIAEVDDRRSPRYSSASRNSAQCRQPELSIFRHTHARAQRTHIPTHTHPHMHTYAFGVTLPRS